ncbi:MAG: sigma-70 family RNA polymerase sigma factor [Planctomycetota bacterium]
MNESALGARLAAHGTRLRLLIAHLAGRAVSARVEADDLVQEVYLRAWAARAELPASDDALGRLLTRIARNVVVDAARAIRAAKRDGATVRLERSAWSRAGAPHAADPAAATVGPATRAGMAEDVHRLVRAFEGLPPDHRRVLGLRRFQGLSARETAARMGRSESAVHSLLRRALLAWDEAGGFSAGSRDESAGGLRPSAP